MKMPSAKIHADEGKPLANGFLSHKRVKGQKVILSICQFVIFKGVLPKLALWNKKTKTIKSKQ